MCIFADIPIIEGMDSQIYNELVKINIEIII